MTSSRFVEDRPGRDRRHAMDTAKVEAELGWRPVERRESGLRKTVRWDRDNTDRVASVQTGGAYGTSIETNGGER